MVNDAPTQVVPFLPLTLLSMSVYCHRNILINSGHPCRTKSSNGSLYPFPVFHGGFKTFLMSPRAKHASSRVGGEAKQPSFGRAASAHDLAFGSARGALLITVGSWIGMGSGCDGI